MRILIIFCALFVFLQASNLKAIKPFLTENKLDILLMLDSSFNGEMIKKDNNRTLTNIQANSKWERTFTNAPINKITIMPNNENLDILIESSEKYILKTSVLKDKQSSIKLSFFQNNTDGISASLNDLDSGFEDIKEKELVENKIAESSALNLLNEQDYIYYILIFALVLIILLILRWQLKRVKNINGAIKIASQTPLDSKNKVMLLETGNNFYMVLVGEKGSVLLDKFPRTESKPKEKIQESTQQFLKKNQKTESKTDLKTLKENGAKLASFDDEFWHALKKK